MISLFNSLFLSFLSILPPPPMGRASEHVSNDHDGAQDMTADLPDDWKVQRETPCQVNPVKNRMPTGMFPQKWVQHIYIVRWLTIESPKTFLMASWKFENPRLKLSFVEVNYCQPCPTDTLVSLSWLKSKILVPGNKIILRRIKI